MIPVQPPQLDEWQHCLQVSKKPMDHPGDLSVFYNQTLCVIQGRLVFLAKFCYVRHPILPR
jgi:hypothetical protein